MILPNINRKARSIDGGNPFESSFQGPAVFASSLLLSKWQHVVLQRDENGVVVEMGPPMWWSTRRSPSDPVTTNNRPLPFQYIERVNLCYQSRVFLSWSIVTALVMITIHSKMRPVYAS